MNDMVIQKLLNHLSQVIDLVGVFIIVFGMIYAIARYFKGMWHHDSLVTIDGLRLQLGRAIVLAVEFLLAADIIRTMVAPDYYSLGLLGGLVIIRTVLTYFLDMELKGIRK